MTAGLRVALGFMVLTFWARGQNASEVDLTPEIGPHSGDVTWSLRNHILTWNTPQLTLNLDPWFTLRHVSGTMSPLTQSPPTLTLDNLRGAHFDAQLDDIWRIEGSLEEMQGYIGACLRAFVCAWVCTCARVCVCLDDSRSLSLSR